MNLEKFEKEYDVLNNYDLGREYIRIQQSIENADNIEDISEETNERETAVLYEIANRFTSFISYRA